MDTNFWGEQDQSQPQLKPSAHNLSLVGIILSSIIILLTFLNMIFLLFGLFESQSLMASGLYSSLSTIANYAFNLLFAMMLIILAQYTTNFKSNLLRKLIIAYAIVFLLGAIVVLVLPFIVNFQNQFDLFGDSFLDLYSKISEGIFVVLVCVGIVTGFYLCTFKNDLVGGLHTLGYSLIGYSLFSALIAIARPIFISTMPYNQYSIMSVFFTFSIISSFLFFILNVIFLWYFVKVWQYIKKK